MYVTAAMRTSRQNVAQVVSHATVPLHETIGPVGTALYDSDGTVLFDNGALRYADEGAVNQAINDCLTNPLPGAVYRCDSENTSAYAISLESQHIFVIVGPHFEFDSIDKYLVNIHELFPKALMTTL